MRRKVEGWAVDISETDAQVGRATLRQRLADNNKLWMISLVAVILATGFLLRGMGRSEEEVSFRPSAKASPSYTDREHRTFAREFAQGKSYGFRVLQADFVAPDRFRIVAPGNVGNEDLSYAARTAGDMIVHRFGFRAVIQVYRRSANGDETLAVTARWEPKKYGYVAKSAERARE